MATTKVTTDNIDLSADTTALEMPTGTTAQRPGNLAVDFLVVAGGGAGGGSFRGGGGGAGGLRTSYGSTSGGGSTAEATAAIALSTEYDVTVGDGGTGGSGAGANGTDSIFSDITSTGGGGGGQWDGGVGLAGGSGGGSAGASGGATSAGSKITNQGFDGGQGFGGATQCGGGGGGAGAAGQNGGASGTAGDGGDGIQSTILNYTNAGTAGVGEQISGSEVWYGGGGGGGAYDNGNDTIPGKGGGGEGGYQSPAPPYPSGSNATDYTGGGGGGSSGTNGGNGGKGVVILRYISSATLTKTGTLVESTGSPFTEDGEKISVFTSGSGTVSFSDSSLVPTEGTLRENTTTGKMEIYVGALGWRALQQTGQDFGIIPSNNFNIVTYSGSSSSQSIDVGFKPDLTWIKSTTASEWHALFDSVRGVPGNNIGTNSQNQQGTNTTTLTSFDTSGFSLGSDATHSVNASGKSYVAWNWKGGGTAVTNNDGQISSQVSANTDAGFSVVTVSYGSTSSTNYTNTFGHGLNQRPDFVITKWYNGSSVWVNILPFIGTDVIINFDTDAQDTDSFFQATATTLKTGYATSANNVVCYCWHSVPGYSEIGYYVGNGSTDGPNVYTGFKPAYVLIKNISNNGRNWNIFDNKRNTSNPRNTALFPNGSFPNSNYTYGVNFNDTGFQVIDSDADLNASNQQMIFMAFSE